MDTLWLVILVTIAGASIFVPVVVVVYSLRLRNLNDPSACSACGYPKQGATAERCPECGHPWNDNLHRRTTAMEEFLVLGALIGIPSIIFILVLVFAMAMR